MHHVDLLFDVAMLEVRETHERSRKPGGPGRYA